MIYVCIIRFMLIYPRISAACASEEHVSGDMISDWWSLSEYSALLDFR